MAVFIIECSREGLLIGLRDKNTKCLVETLKYKLTDLTGYRVMATHSVYDKAKKKVFREFRVCNWESIDIGRFNHVFAYIEELQKEDVGLRN